MSTLAIKLDPFAVEVSYTVEELRVVLAEGRDIIAPIECFPRLRDASPAARAN